MLRKGWGRTHHRARMFQTLPVSLVQTRMTWGKSLHLCFSICGVMTLPRAMWCSSQQYQLWHLLKSNIKTAQSVHSHLSLYNHFFSTFTTSLRSKADIMTSKAKGRLSYLYRENTPSLPISSFSQQECFNTWVPAAQGQSSTFSATKPKEVIPISLTQSHRIKVFCLWVFSSWQASLFYFPPPCHCSETQFHTWTHPYPRHPTGTRKK